LFLSFFFFQAEDGIRDRNVTGVQTCALPILKFCSQEIGKTSTGNGKPLKRCTNFDSSTIQMIFLELIATFFSKVNAPPPPLIPSKLLATRSAPSTVKSA